MTDDFDDAIRSRLQQTHLAQTGSAHEVLEELRPAMRRARIKRSLVVGTAALSVVGVFGLGVVAAIDSVAQDPAEIDILIDGDRLPDVTPVPSTSDPERDEVTDGDATVDVSTTLTPDTSTTAAPTTTAVTTTLPEATSGTAPESDAPAPTTAPVQPTPPATTSPSPPPPSATTNPPDTTAPATTAPSPTTSAAPPPTAPPASGQQTVQSNCGSITVSWTGNDISLTSTQPAAGFSPDIRQTGPAEVEVRFDNGSAECEIEAWIESGTLRTDVENEGGDDD